MDQETPTTDGQITAPERFRETFGPWPHSAALLWQQLVDFEHWPDWWPDLQSVQQLDKGNVGRGSKLQVSSRFDQQVWEIIYWQVGSRVDFEIGDRYCRAGLSFVIQPADNTDHATLTLDMEFIPLTTARLLAFLARRRLRRRALRLLTALADHLHGQQPVRD